MKVRARKTKYNTPLDFDDLLLKEFSQDKEKFVNDPELSCNECYDIENISLNQDSPTSFLIKFKASMLSDPSAITPGVKGYILPENGYTFNKTPSTPPSPFTSINNNHYEMILTDSQTHDVANYIYNTPASHIDIPKLDATNYVIDSCQQSEWYSFYQRADKSNWKKHLGKKLREKYKNVYGPFDDSSIGQSLKMDSAGVKSLVSLLRTFNFLDTAEELILKKHIP